ncbi:acyl-CoA thioesterase [Seohaeicola saemankumensis]|nr:thioesterase family protein [Seohaeicola saemankumensis]MCA0871057.1 acyl-CoA thioesterase [Seohaeicola saemankumensis]
MAPRPPVPTRSDFSAFQTIQTRWMDNDMYGHMNNVVHYSLFDTAVNGWLIEHSLLDPRTSDSFGLVVETGCKYHAEMGFPDVITAGIRVAHLGTSSVRYEIGLFRNDEDSASANGFFIHVYVDRTSRRPVAISNSMRKAFVDLMRTG